MSLFLFVRHCFAGLIYALPALGILFLLIERIQAHDSLPVLAVILIFFIGTNILYYNAITERMVGSKTGAINFFAAMRWHSKHTDILLLISLEIFILVLLVFYFSDAVFYLYETNQILAEQKQLAIEEQAHPFFVSKLTILLFGSRFASGVFLFFSLIGWFYVCRVGIRLPAFADGYFLRTNEAMGLTNDSTFSIFTISFLYYFCVSSLLTAISNIYDIAPESTLYHLLIVAQYYILIQLHIALWVRLYQEKVSSYNMVKKLN